MALDHNAATATIILDGLAVCCFNKKTLRWQVGFIQQPEHNVMLSVSTTRKEVIIPSRPVLAGSNISIYTEGGIAPDYENTYKDGFFDCGSVNRKVSPNTPDEEKNFRWVVDLEGQEDLQHGRVRLKRPANPVVLTTISDAVFYNKEVTPPPPHHFFVLPDGIDPNKLQPNELKKYEFGQVDDEAAADIRCEGGGSVKIKIDENIVGSLNARPDRRYLIRLSNMRQHQHPHGSHSRVFEKTDFSLYYDVLEVEQKFAMWGIPPRFRSGRVSCNISRLSVSEDLSVLTGQG